MNIKLKITKPGTQTRNFTHINDTINALMLIAEKGNGDEYGIAQSREVFHRKCCSINFRRL